MSRTAEEWGRLAVSLPGWRLLPGMRTIDRTGQAARVVGPSGAATLEGVAVRLRLMQSSPIDPDDHATAGALLALLEGANPRPYRRPGGLWVVATGPGFALEPDSLQPRTLGRACIAAAEALGRWP